MAQSLEVMSGEDSGQMDVSLDVSTSAGGAAPSTSPSWMRRLLLVAAPVCMVVLGYVGSQALLSNGINDEDVPMNSYAIRGKRNGEKAVEGVELLSVASVADPPKRQPEEGLRLGGATAEQLLTGEKFGGLTRVILKDVSFPGIFKGRSSPPLEDYATLSSWLFPHAKLTFVPIDEATRPQEQFVEGWPLHAVATDQTNPLPNANNTSARFRKTAAKDRLKIRDLNNTRTPVVSVRVRPEALNVLLGSCFGRPAAAGTWTAQAASVFGVWLGDAGSAAVARARAGAGGEGVAAAAAAAAPAERQGARGWLALELLEERAASHKEPLVLDEQLQWELVQMDKNARARKLSDLGPLEPYAPSSFPRPGQTWVSAYEVIATLFRNVKVFSSKGVYTILDVGDFFTASEFSRFVTGFVGEFKATSSNRNAAKHLVAAASRAQCSAGAADAEARRSGPRFLLRCLLLLEKRSKESAQGQLQDSDLLPKSSSEDVKAAQYLRENMPGFLKEELGLLLKTSDLKVLRRGPMEFDGTMLGEFGKFDKKKVKAVELFGFPAFLGEQVVAEEEEQSDRL